MEFDPTANQDIDSFNATNISSILNPPPFDCIASSSIANDKGFRFLLILELGVAIIASTLNAILLWILRHVTVFHTNLRVILAHMSLNLLIYTLACGVKETIMLVQIFSSQNECRLVMNAFQCKLQELSNTIPIGLTVFTSLALCVERFYSTVRYRLYDQGHKGPWLALILMPITWALILWSQLGGLLSIPQDKTVPVCESLISMNAGGAVQVLAMNLTAEILTVAMALHLYFWNNYKLKTAAANRAKHTLSSRFQISQNVQINSLMLPSMLFQTFCYLPNYLFLLIVIVGIPFSANTRTWLLHVNYLWKEVYALAHPLMALKRNVHIMEQLRKRGPKILLKTFGLLDQVGKVAPVIMVTPASGRNRSAADMHFEVLDRMWDQQRQQQKRGLQQNPVIT